MTYNQQYKIFVSSPNDVAAERDIVDEVIAKINDAISDTLGIYLTVEKWEKLPPETTDVEFQERLNEKIKECHFFLYTAGSSTLNVVPASRLLVQAMVPLCCFTIFSAMERPRPYPPSARARDLLAR